MPNDIRSFFGAKPSAEVPPKAPATKSSKSSQSRTKRNVLEDSDDDGPKKSTPRKAAPKKREPSPEGEETNASEYFGKSKPKKSAPLRTSATSKDNSEDTPSAKSTPKSRKVTTTTSNGTTPNGRSSSRKKGIVNYNETRQQEATVKDEEIDDVVQPEFKSIGKGLDDDYVKGEVVSDDDVKPALRNAGMGRQSKLEDDEDDFAPDEDVDMKDEEPDEDLLIPDEDEDIEITKPSKANRAAASAGRKRKSYEFEEDEADEDEKPTKKAKAAKASPKKPAAKKKEKAADVPENLEMKAIFDSIPLVRAPSPEVGGEPKKWKFGDGKANTGPAPAAGSIEMPVGQENCLAGLSFVFTGLLTSLGRPEGQALVKRYGGKVMGSPSTRTSYVVLGSDAGPKKLEAIAAHKLKSIDEHGLFELIRRLPANGGDSKAAAKSQEKQDVEMAKVKKLAAEAEKEEQKAAAESEKLRKLVAEKAAKDVSKSVGAGRAAVTQKALPASKATASGPDNRLWTVKHAPTQLGQICGNKQAVEKLQRWLRAFPQNLDRDFKLAGPDGSGIFRAVIISGPPGIGKTTAAHLVANLEGYDVVESNASDTRSKKLVESNLKGVLDTTSLLGYFAGDFKKVVDTKKKLCLIMDEVDGMSAGDRGGVGALAAVCKKSKVPMILICNERKLPKLKPFDFCTFALPFRRPTTDQIRSRIMTIGFREGITLPKPVLDAIIEGTQADIRQIVNMISTAKIDQDINESALDFDRGKQMSKAWQKHIVLKPWDIVGKIIGGGMFASTSKATLNDKIELYFNDHSIAPLMFQENYLGTTPIRASAYAGRERALKNLELVEQAANSISEGDLVDRLIHGTEQQWSLMPAHAVLSFVRPASFIAGSMAGHTSGFPQWLGKNSTQGRLLRSIKELQGHMRLRTSGDRHEIRQQYLPLLWSKLVKILETGGKESVPEVIALMDSYFLTKDDWDAILELGVGPMDMERVKVESQTKATFTRSYNSQNHPMPFMKASNVIAPKRMAKEKPDLEEAFDESDGGELIDDVKGEEDESGADGDVLKDKYVKAKKKKAAPKGKGKKKAAIADSDDDASDEEEEEKPKKGKGKAKAKAPAKSRGKK